MMFYNNKKSIHLIDMMCLLEAIWKGFTDFLFHWMDKARLAPLEGRLPTTEEKSGTQGCQNQDPTKDRWGIEKA
jgi:hypothetical protein